MLILNNKVMKKIAALAMVAILLLTIPGISISPAMAQTQADKPDKGLFGEVIAKDDNSVTVRSKSAEKETTIKLKVDKDTLIKLPGIDSPGSMANVFVGSRVAVLAKGEDPAMTVVKIMPVAAEPRREHRAMTVLDTRGNTIISLDDKGQQVEVEIQLQPGMQLGNMKGQLITFVGVPGEKPDSFKAQAMIICDDVIKELEVHLQKLETEVKAEPDNAMKSQKQQALEQAKMIMEDNMQKHLDRLSEAIARVRDDTAKSALRNVLNDTLKRHEDQRSKMGRSSVHQGELELRHQGAVDNISKIDDKTAITIKTENGGKVTLKLDDNPQIRKGRGQGSMDDVRNGMSVTMKFDDKTGLVKEVRIKDEAEIKGTVQSFDKATGNLEIRLPDGTAQMVKIAAGAVLDVQGPGDLLSAIVPGAMVEVKSGDNIAEATRIKVVMQQQVKGIIKEINLASGTATIITPSGVEIKIKLDDTTKVSVRGMLVGAQSLQLGNEIEIELEQGSGKVLRLTDRSGRSAANRSGSSGGDRSGKFEAEVVGTVKNVELATAAATTATGSSGAASPQSGGADSGGRRGGEARTDAGATSSPGATSIPGATSAPAATSSPRAEMLNFWLKILGVGRATAQTTTSTPGATGTPKPASSPGATSSLDDRGGRAGEIGDDRGGSSRGGSGSGDSGSSSGSSSGGGSGSGSGGSGNRSGMTGKLSISMGNGDTLNLIITPNTRIEMQKGALQPGAVAQVRFNTSTMEANRVEVNPQAKLEGEVFGTVITLEAGLAAAAAQLMSTPAATGAPASTAIPGATTAPGATSAPAATSSPTAKLLNFWLKILGIGRATAQTTTSTPGATGTPKPASSPGATSSLDDRGGRAGEIGDDRGGSSRGGSGSGGSGSSGSGSSSGISGGGSGLTGRLSVMLGNGDTLNMLVSPNTKINLEKGALQLGAMVQIRFNTVTMEASLVKPNPEISVTSMEPDGSQMRGTAAVVNFALNLLMVSPSKGEPMTFLLRPSTVINTEKSPLQVGSIVEVKFNPATMEAIRVEVNPSGLLAPQLVGPSGSPDDKGSDRASETGDDRGGERGGGSGGSGGSGGGSGGGGGGGGK